VLVGLGRLDLAVGTQQTGRLLSLVLAAMLLAGGVGVVSLPFASLAGYVFVHATSLLLARKITHETCFRVAAFNLVHLRSLVAVGSGVAASSLINLLLGPLNEFALTRYVGPSSVPVYDIAFTVTMQLRSVLESGFRSLMPEVSRLKTLGSEDARLRIRAVYGRAMKVIWGLGLPAFGGAILAAHILLHLWLGARFRPELVGAVRVLLLGGFASLLGAPGYYMLLGVRSVKHVVAAVAVQSGVNAAALGYLCYAGFLSALAVASAASAGIAAGGLYLFFTSRAAYGSSSWTHRTGTA
jgi:O-antigen/teichoic acid export membrane protein